MRLLVKVAILAVVLYYGVTYVKPWLNGMGIKTPFSTAQTRSYDFND